MSLTYRCPGRVNLIGEHTDYNGGFVMPAAIDLYTWAELTPRADRRMVVRSTAFPDVAEWDLDDSAPPVRRHWSNYLRGMAAMLERAGHRLRGAEIALRGDLPIGGGMSSSAAFEIVCGYAWLDASGLAVDRGALALAGQAGDHEYVGIRCGIMDQFICAHGRAGHAMLLDTRSLDFEWLPLPPGISLVVGNTMVRHELATAAYNERRAECEAGVAALAARRPGITSLRDVVLDDFEPLSFGLPDNVYRRCWHVITENARVRAAATALRHGEFPALGRLFNESHFSLRNNYEVSCPELDTMAKICRRQPGVYGARMMGGGFGGCVIALADTAAVPEIVAAVGPAYAAAAGLVPDIHVCHAAAGVARVTS